ncbi:MAG: hypothetical protein ACTSV5_11020 [Promethearchaeota archaeon]
MIDRKLNWKIAYYLLIKSLKIKNKSFESVAGECHERAEFVNLDDVKMMLKTLLIM